MKYNRDLGCIIDIETDKNLMNGGRIISISLMNVATKEISSFYNEREEKLIMEFLRYYNKFGFKKVIGFNINFDRRFIFAKCMKYNLSANGFFKARTTDIMTILKGIDGNLNYNRPGKLCEWSELIGKNDINKSAPVPVLFKEGRIDEIIEYNKSHVRLIFQLYTKIKLVIGT